MFKTAMLILFLSTAIQGVNSSCTVGEYRCKNISPEVCINSTLVGDGHADCADNSDEVQVTCAKQDSFVCSSGACVPYSYRFDNTTDCPDSIDEAKYLGDWCDPTHTSFPCWLYTNNSECVNSTCICQTGWKQINYNTCHRASSTCAVGLYKCKNIWPEVCINASLVGDGHADCADNSDEVQITCSKYNRFVCTAGGCIPFTYRFDNHSDCPDGGDEAKYLGDWCDPTHTSFPCSLYTHNSECVNSTCICQNGWTQINYNTCQRDEVRTTTDSNLECTNGYVVSNNGSQCVPTTQNLILSAKLELGDSCNKDTECSKSVNYSECSNSVCVCIHGYVEGQNRTECRLNMTIQNPRADYSKVQGPFQSVIGAIIATVVVIASAALVAVGAVLYTKRPRPPPRTISMYRQDTTISRRFLSLSKINGQFGITVENCPPSTPPTSASYPVVDVTGVNVDGGN